MAVAILDDDVRGIQMEADAVTVTEAVRLISAKLNALPTGNFRAMVARKLSAGVWTLPFRTGTGRRFRRRRCRCSRSTTRRGDTPPSRLALPPQARIVPG